MTPPEKKKKKSDAEDNPFDFDDDMMNQINEQIRKIFESLFPGQNLPENFMKDNAFSKAFQDMVKQLGDPSKLSEKDRKELENQFRKMGSFRPFVWGLNMNLGPDGKPKVNSFGDIKPKKEGDTEIRPDRDPMIDKYIDGDQLVVVAEVPGVQKEDIELRASKNELEILAESKAEGPQKRKYHKVVVLEQDIDPGVAKARYQNGILEVRLYITGKQEDRKKINID
jgi:HSP20 family protein